MITFFMQYPRKKFTRGTKYSVPGLLRIARASAPAACFPRRFPLSLSFFFHVNILYQKYSINTIRKYMPQNTNPDAPHKYFVFRERKSLVCL